MSVKMETNVLRILSTTKQVCKECIKKIVGMIIKIFFFSYFVILKLELKISSNPGKKI